MSGSVVDDVLWITFLYIVDYIPLYCGLPTIDRNVIHNTSSTICGPQYILLVLSTTCTACCPQYIHCCPQHQKPAQSCIPQHILWVQYILWMTNTYIVGVSITGHVVDNVLYVVDVYCGYIYCG